MRKCAFLSLLIVVGLSGCGDGGVPEPSPEQVATQPTDTTPPIPISQREPTTLTERDVTRYLAVMAELRRSESRLQSDLQADTLGVVINEGALAASPAAQRIIARQGFATLEEFHQVAYSIAIALEAAAQGTADAMPMPDDPEERKAFEEIRAAMGEFSSTQPAGNVELVTRYRERLVNGRR